MRLSCKTGNLPLPPKVPCLISPYYSTDNFPKNSCILPCSDVKTSSGVPSTAMTPLSIKMILSATFRAKFISCVTITIVICSAARSLITFKISPVSSGSSAEVGSSKTASSVSSPVPVRSILAAAALRRADTDMHPPYPQVPSL